MLSPSPSPIPFENTFARDLVGLYVPWQPAQVASPSWACWNESLAEELGLGAYGDKSAGGLAIWSGNALPSTAEPIAQAYAGHQFGHFSPQLGDGRALLIGELIDSKGQRRDVAFKGSGRTPFSRNGDGLAALGPMLREYLMGEAMHALGIPSSRALAVIRTGSRVMRETPQPGAILTRVAASHIRVGTFEYVVSRGEDALLKRLADYSIARHYPHLVNQPNQYLRFFAAVVEKQAALIAQWMGVGFIHGVMNTDNMTISGETIDFGPCAFMEHYDTQTVFSSIDHAGRYAYGNQPAIAHWNLLRFAETLLPIIDANPERATELATEVVMGFVPRYKSHWNRLLCSKIGLDTTDESIELANDFLRLLQTHRIDYTLAFHSLGDAATGKPEALSALFGEARATELQTWLQRWEECIANNLNEKNKTLIAAKMQQINPIYIPRNHLVEDALSAATEQNDMQPSHAILKVLKAPFTENDANALYAAPASAEQTACYQTFCGT